MEHAPTAYSPAFSAASLPLPCTSSASLVPHHIPHLSLHRRDPAFPLPSSALPRPLAPPRAPERRPAPGPGAPGGLESGAGLYIAAEKLAWAPARCGVNRRANSERRSSDCKVDEGQGARGLALQRREGERESTNI